MTYTTTATKRRQPRPLTTEDRLRQEIAALKAQLEQQQARFDAIVADLQRQHWEKLQIVVDDANRHIERMEEKANREKEAAQQRQVDHDNAVIAAWVETAETLQAENEALCARVAELERPVVQPKRKKAKARREGRWELEEE